MVTSVSKTFHCSLDIGANHFRTAFDVVFLGYESAAVNIEPRIPHVDSLYSNALFSCSHICYFIVRGTEHSDEVGLLGKQSRRLKRWCGLLNLNGCEIHGVDLCKSGKQKP